MLKKSYLIVLIGVIAWLAVPGRLLAETAEGGAEELFNQIQQLERLKTENPSEYQAAIAQKRTTFRERMMALRSQDPVRFGAFLDRQAEDRHRRMQFLKQNHPQEFRRFMAARMERFERLSAENPEAAENFLANHPGVRDRIEQFKLKREEFAQGRHLEDHGTGPGFQGQDQNQPSGQRFLGAHERGEDAAGSQPSRGRMPPPGGRPGIRRGGEFSEDRVGVFQGQRESREGPGGRRGASARRQRPQ